MSDKAASCIGSGPTLIHFGLIFTSNIFKDPIPKQIHRISV